MISHPHRLIKTRGKEYTQVRLILTSLNLELEKNTAQKLLRQVKKAVQFHKQKN